MTGAYFTKQYKSTSYAAYCPACNLRIVAFNDADFVDCDICGSKLESNRIVIDVWQDPKYTTASC